MAEGDQASRRDVLLGMLQSEYPNYHPLVSIARIAHHQDADLKTQLECHKTIAKYVEPELKSIEVKGDIGHRHKVSVSLFEPAATEFGPAVETPSLQHDKTSRTLPGGSIIDVDPVVVDRTVSSW
jgi:hypothetical protein